MSDIATRAAANPLAADTPRLFSFARQQGQQDAMRDLVAGFADLHPYRSAMVDELVLDEDFYRRPARPEDLSFIRFDDAVTPETVTLLPSLAAQRLLLSINEMDICRLPRDGSPDVLADFERFYGAESRTMGARIRPFLEDFVFDHLSDTPAPVDAGEQAGLLRDILNREAGFWGLVAGHLRRKDFLEQGLRFILIQKWSLAETRRAALARAGAAGFFQPLGADGAPKLALDAVDDRLIARLARHCDVDLKPHSYWQFYLSTSLGSCNLLHALAARPDRALALWGAAFAAEAEWISFGCLLAQAAEGLGIDAGAMAGGVGGGGGLAGHNLTPAAAIEDLGRRFARAQEIAEARFGQAGLARIGQGLAAASAMRMAAERDLSEQLQWLSSIDRYRDIAGLIDRRIQAECPDIDRETFVEPREMCSTTHVHDDHRLVAVETGDMVFWGNLGMSLALAPGEMVLVPMGRLHGSSILSDECVYHQPIIPEDWIEPLVAGLRLGAPG